MFKRTVFLIKKNDRQPTIWVLWKPLPWNMILLTVLSSIKQKQKQKYTNYPERAIQATSGSENDLLQYNYSL